MDLLWLVSRKIRPPRSRFRQPQVLKKTWLNRTVFPDGKIRPAYQNLLPALAGLASRDNDLRRFNQALSMKNSENPREIWLQVLKAPLDSTKMHSFADLVDKLGNYGPQTFASALNKLARQHTDDPQLVRDLVSASVAESPALAPYITGSVVEQITSRSPALSVQIVNQLLAEAPDNVKTVALDAFFYGTRGDPYLVAKHVPQLNGIPEDYKLPNKCVSMLNKHAHHLACVPALKRVVPYLPMGLEYDRLLRRVYTNSDEGAELVREIAITSAVPATIYPFIVKRLCEQATTVPLRESRTRQLDDLFNGKFLELATKSPGLLLHLLIVRTIAIDGIAATAPILNKWEESDEKGVNMETWLLLFACFRRSGYPDKCLEILSRIISIEPKVDMQVVSEYLHFTAHYYHLHAYLAAMHRILPEADSTLQYLGIHDHADKIPDTTEPPLCPLKPLLTADNRAFSVNMMHETWLLATYHAVLATVESVDDAALLHKNYINYAQRSHAATSLKVTDQFVELLTGKLRSDIALDAAELIFREALSRLNLQFASDGRNHSKSLETLCYQLIKRGKTDRAMKLLIHVSETPHAVIKGTALQPLIQQLPIEMREGFVKWASQVGAKVNAAGLL